MQIFPLNNIHENDNVSLTLLIIHTFIGPIIYGGLNLTRTFFITAKCKWQNFCHTRLHLGFSDGLKIFQVPTFKIEPQSGCIMQKTPSTHQPNSLSWDMEISAQLSLIKYLRISRRCLEDISNFCHNRLHLGFSAGLKSSPVSFTFLDFFLK